MLSGGLLIILVAYACLVTRLYLKAKRSRAENNKLSPPVEDGSRLLHPPLQKGDEDLRFRQTFQKFVPRQFVDHFSKHGSDTLELGRADEDEVAILFCDIRGFAGLS